MRKALVILVLSVTTIFGLGQDASFSGGDALPAEGQTPPPASGLELIVEGLERLPHEPLTMTGQLIMRLPRGVVSKSFLFEVFFEWGAEPPVAIYKIFDMKTNLLETVHATAGHTPTLKRTLPGSDEVTNPEWNERIQGTDLTWLDATVAFLWWKDPTLANKTERIKGRLCDIVDIFPPTPVPDCAKVRMWLDREVKLLMQAEEHSPAGKTNRKLWVRAVKKIRGRWMIRDMEVELRGTGHRTRLHIEDVKDVE